MKENKIKQSEVREILRSQITLAAYNPRKISPEARKKLKANLKRIGLLGGIIWNERTGNLVSGHQKVSIMDEVNHYDIDTHENDYNLRVEVVNLSEKEEKEQNLFMNNRNAQGEYDDDMLRDMLTDIDFSFAGFDDFDIQLLGVDTGDGEDWAAMHTYADTTWKAEDEIGENEELSELHEKTKAEEEQTNFDRSVNFYEDTPENKIARHNEVQKIKDRINDKASGDNDRGALSYLVISFSSPSEREGFMEKYGLDPFTRYIDSKTFDNILEFGIEEDEEE